MLLPPPGEGEGGVRGTLSVAEIFRRVILCGIILKEFYSKYEWR
jgi:hypothetical protein